MTHLSGTIQITPQHRLFSSMKNLILIVDGLFVAVRATHEGAKWRGPPSGLMPFKSAQFGVTVSWPTGDPIRTLVERKPWRRIPVFIFNTEKIGPPIHKKAFSTTLPPRIFENMIAPFFIEFFERHRPWIRNTYGRDIEAWPPLINFSRAVRNWIAHHEGCVHFDNPRAQPVKWHHLSYGPADDGRKVVGRDLHFAEMIILLLEISDELDRLGCPT